MEDTVEEEVILEFKRFSAEKQEQVRQLVSYATLMGLSGKDLVSIGGKLDRIKARNESTAMIRIAEGYYHSIQPVSRPGKDGRTFDEHRKWKYTDQEGKVWHFNTDSRFSCDVRSIATGKRRHFYLEDYTLGRRLGKDGPKIAALLALHHGDIVLDF